MNVRRLLNTAKASNIIWKMFMKIRKIICVLNVGNLLARSHIQGDPNQDFRFQMTIPLSVCISDPMLVKPKCVWEAVVFYEFQLIFYTCKLLMPKMPKFFIKRRGLMVKAVDWFKSYPGYKRFPYFWKNFVFFLLFQKPIFYHKKLLLLKHILALPTWGQKCKFLDF